jgi:hypothetical protein
LEFSDSNFDSIKDLEDFFTKASEEKIVKENRINQKDIGILNSTPPAKILIS